MKGGTFGLLILIVVVVSVCGALLVVSTRGPVRSETTTTEQTQCQSYRMDITSVFNSNVGDFGIYESVENGTLIANGAPEIRVTITQFVNYLPYTEVRFVYFQPLNATTGMFFFSTNSGVYITECSVA